MQETGVHNRTFGADKNLKGGNWNLDAPQLTESSLRAGKVLLSSDSARVQISASSIPIVWELFAENVLRRAASP